LTWFVRAAGICTKWGGKIMVGPSVIRRNSDKGVKMDRWIGTARAGAKTTGRRPSALPLIVALTAALAWFLPGAALSDTASPTTARFPFGLYAHVDIEDVLQNLVKKFNNIQITQSATEACAVVAASSGELAKLHDAFQTFLHDFAVRRSDIRNNGGRALVQGPNRTAEQQLCSRSRALPSGRQ
jgi:hypothetical protein